MKSILSKMYERAAERQDEWQTRLVSQFPDPYGLKEITLMGSHSYTLMTSKQRLIIRNDAIKIRELFETPASTARDYLAVTFKKGPRISAVQGDSLRKGLAGMPNFAEPTQFEHGFYIDVKGAYWSIMQIFGWNVDYKPGDWLSPGIAPSDFPFPNNKIARNCLVSVAIPGTISRYMPKGYFDEIKPGNPLANVSLYRLISDTLHSIAREAKRAGAVYVNTDGYIAPDEQTAAKIVRLIHEWGLTASIKAEGRGAVKSSGAYAVGSEVSVPYKLRRHAHRVDNIHAPNYSHWLQDQFQFWAKESA